MTALPHTSTSAQSVSGVVPMLRLHLSTWWRRIRQNWAIFRRNHLAMVGVLLLIVFALMAILQPILIQTRIWPRGIYHAELGYDQSVSPWPSEPVPGHILGIDALGRDNLSRLMAATRPTFVLAMVAAAVTALISTLVGAFSAYYRGVTDFVFTHLADAFLLMPAPVIMIILSSRFYADMDAVRFGIIYGVITGAGSGAIVMRAQALRLMAQPFIEAARVAGASPWRIIFRHLVPHMLPLAAAHMMSVVVGAVVADGFIAFMGLRSIRLNWGQLVYEAITWLDYLGGRASYLAIFAPAFALSLFAAAFYFISRGLHDVADPRLQKRD